MTGRQPPALGWTTQLASTRPGHCRNFHHFLIEFVPPLPLGCASSPARPRAIEVGRPASTKQHTAPASDPWSRPATCGFTLPPQRPRGARPGRGSIYDAWMGSTRRSRGTTRLPRPARAVRPHGIKRQKTDSRPCRSKNTLIDLINMNNLVVARPPASSQRRPQSASANNPRPLTN